MREPGAGFDNVEQASRPSFDLTAYSLPLSAMIDEIVCLLMAPRPANIQGQKVIYGELQARGRTGRGHA